MTMIRDRAALALFAFGVILRLAGLGTAPFWYDESYTALIINSPIQGAMMALEGDTHPPGYYMLLAPFALFGKAEWLYRLPSALAGIALMPIVWGIVRELGWGRRAQIAVLAAVAVLPSYIHYSQEARMYALLALVVAFAYYCILTRLDMVFVLSGITMLYLHNYGLFYWPLLCLIYLLRERNIRETFLLFSGPLIAFSPWAFVLGGQMQTVQAGYWIQPVTPGAVLYSLYSLMAGFSGGDAIAVIAVGVIGVLGWALVRFGQARPPAWLDILLLAFGPLALAIIASLAWKPVLLFRGLIGSVLFMLLVIGWAAARLQRLRLLTLAGIVIPLLFTCHFNYYLFNAVNKVGDLHSFLAVARASGVTTVIHANDGSYIGWSWYAPELNHVRLADTPGCQTLGALSARTRRGLGVSETEPDQVRGPVLLAWGWGPTSSICEYQKAEQISQRPGAELLYRMPEDENLFTNNSLWRIP
jgi:uncharacterized membrane protein